MLYVPLLKLPPSNFQAICPTSSAWQGRDGTDVKNVKSRMLLHPAKVQLLHVSHPDTFILLLQYNSGRPDYIQVASVHLVLYQALTHYDHKQLLKKKCSKMAK